MGNRNLVKRYSQFSSLSSLPINKILPETNFRIRNVSIRKLVTQIHLKGFDRKFPESCY